jgi:hypothetical protein
VILVLMLIVSGVIIGLGPSDYSVSASQSQDPMISVDAPGQGATVRSGSRISIGGWAADPLSSGAPGVDAAQGVHVYFGRPAGENVPMVKVPYGTARPDVVAAFGRSDWSSAGFSGEVVVPQLPLGPSTLYVYAFFDRVGWQSVSVPVEVEVAAPVVGGTQSGTTTGGAGAGPTSTPVPAYTPSDIPGPTDLILVVANPVGAVLRWRAPASTEVVSYRVYFGATTGGATAGGRTPVPTATLYSDCLLGAPPCPGSITWRDSTSITIEGLPYAPVRTFFVTGVTADGRETAPSNRIRMVTGVDPFS